MVADKSSSDRWGSNPHVTVCQLWGLEHGPFLGPHCLPRPMEPTVCIPTGDLTEATVVPSDLSPKHRAGLGQGEAVMHSALGCECKGEPSHRR